MLSDGDVEYIRDNFVALQELCTARGMDFDEARTLIEQRRLPRPSYTLDDGTDMVPPDYFALYDAAGPAYASDSRRRSRARREERRGPRLRRSSAPGVAST